MRLTTKGRYGVRAVVNLASSYANRPISIKTIAKEEGISPEFLEQIFFRLKKAGVISSIRGPGGGFVLNRKASDISIRDILEAVGESTAPTPCTSEEEAKICPRRDACVMVTTWEGFSDIITDYLSKVSIKDIMDKAGKKFYENIATGQDFTI
ncbi:MAG TPA: RrF2 family transcriptional regulator [Spirochaetia bacterium]|nr:RrF2 family transcriptional regulator [Spirochaetia bacterium]